ncbi:FliA/WhiG family RNA polymerase sigma factor [Alkalibaculum sp. M08DMB]|uniref:FliA/WhiG family RNA polymerase sigma factor n=1 Tax=Alkalibaculum sporogenes TaxID=2655001 RepID=A0A6A7K6R9_9FIRM|nr:FliA/WhiG family RNA polymerase sigma factor [Alkalibaculum sporogenes]MPW24813.1 FliA/WhiG family RNA polymerase sigma factor [Alkalibaculum sporogenes]
MSYPQSDQDSLIIKYLPLVKRVVGRIEVKDSEYEKEDLLSVGVMGLMDAIKKYDNKKQVPFEAYATLRIRGTVIDELRKSGRVSRDKIAKLNQYYSAKEDLEKRLVRTPDESEICEELGIGDKELYKLHETVHYLSKISLESAVYSKNGDDIQLIDMVEDNNTFSPEEQYVKNEEKEVLSMAISKLKDRERIILNLYYVEELPLKDIAYILDISIPRVSQIHGKVLIKLRQIIKPMLEE